MHNMLYTVIKVKENLHIHKVQNWTSCIVYTLNSKQQNNSDLIINDFYKEVGGEFPIRPTMQFRHIKVVCGLY